MSHQVAVPRWPETPNTMLQANHAVPKRLPCSDHIVSASSSSIVLCLDKVVHFVVHNLLLVGLRDEGMSKSLISSDSFGWVAL